MRFVNFAGHPRLVGQFVDVVITEAMSNSLRGRVATSWGADRRPWMGPRPDRGSEVGAKPTPASRYFAALYTARPST